MRALLISDTHGKLDIINQLIEKTNADIVIHAGDFGFYDETSYQHLSARELLLLITHSPKKLWNINLPDSKDGYSVLSYENKKFYIESYSDLI